jgi:hypothetical protein
MEVGEWQLNRFYSIQKFLSGVRNRKECENMGKSRASKMNGYRSMVSRQKNDVFKFKSKKKKKG